MRSLIAVVIATSVCSLQARALAFHVHAAAEHVVSDRHTHAPAIHHHHDNDRHHDADRRPHVDADDASAIGTVFTIAVPAGTAPGLIDIDAECAAKLSVPELQIIGDARAIEVRSHGPPPARNPFLRGPPSFAIS